MSLSISQVADVTKELAQSDDKITNANQSIANTNKDKQDLLNKNDTIKTFYQDFNSMVNSYFDEHRWINGTTYTNIPFVDITNGAKRAQGNIFYPVGWTNFAPFAADKVKGLPTSSSPNSESGVFLRAIEDDGLSALIDFIVNGQSSGVADDTLDSLGPGYSPGDSEIEVTSGGQTPGNVLLISGSGTSALVNVVGVDGTTLTIEEIVQPANTINASGSQVVENFSGFTNGERNTLTSGTYQRVLTELSINLISAVTDWESSITGQLMALIVTDPDKVPEKTAAGIDATNAADIIDAWQLLPNTGSSGDDSKFTDNNLISLTNEISARTTFISTRSSQISQALGTLSQNSEGIIGGQGLLRKRFESISLQINGADGPLFQHFALDATKGAAQQQLESTKQKNAVFSSGVYFTKLSENATGSNTVTVENASNFNTSQRVVITADGLDNLIVDITDKNGNTLTLSKIVPKEYILELGAAVSRAR